MSYIEREAYTKYLATREADLVDDYGKGWSAGVHAAKEAAETFPAADAAPVRHGRWDGVKNPQWPAYSHDKCSVCGWLNTKNALCYDGGHKPGHSLNYCPNCGAKMDGGAE